MEDIDERADGEACAEITKEKHLGVTLVKFYIRCLLQPNQVQCFQSICDNVLMFLMMSRLQPSLRVSGPVT